MNFFYFKIYPLSKCCCLGTLTISLRWFCCTVAQDHGTLPFVKLSTFCLRSAVFICYPTRKDLFFQWKITSFNAAYKIYGRLVCYLLHWKISSFNADFIIYGRLVHNVLSTPAVARFSLAMFTNSINIVFTDAILDCLLLAICSLAIDSCYWLFSKTRSHWCWQESVEVEHGRDKGEKKQPLQALFTS